MKYLGETIAIILLIAALMFMFNPELAGENLRLFLEAMDAGATG